MNFLDVKSDGQKKELHDYVGIHL